MNIENPDDFLPADVNFATLREKLITKVENSFTRGERRFAEFFGRRSNFFDHMNEIKSEFLGRSELLYAHAGLIVALRRRMYVEHFRPLFFRLWREEGPFLRENLSLRWLVSAADTLIDYGENSAQKALAMAVVLFVNTIKLHETERHIHGLRNTDLDIVYSPSGFLFDGLTCFSISDGDMIQNMQRRARSLIEEDDIAGPLLDEVMRRISSAPTVFRRMADLKKAADADPVKFRKIAPQRGRKP